MFLCVIAHTISQMAAVLASIRVILNRVGPSNTCLSTFNVRAHIFIPQFLLYEPTIWNSPTHVA